MMTGKSWESQFDDSPFRFALKVVLFGTMVLGVIILSLSLLGVFSTGIGVVNETVQVVREEFGPRGALGKYEWFKAASASLDKKTADIKVYQVRTQGLTNAYDGSPRIKWAREDREQLSVWQSEVAGIKASYNQLAAEYNSEMSKFNWRFANRGMLPQGATEPLPREYKPYIEE